MEAGWVTGGGKKHIMQSGRQRILRQSDGFPFEVTANALILLMNILSYLFIGCSDWKSFPEPHNAVASITVIKSSRAHCWQSILKHDSLIKPTLASNSILQPSDVKISNFYRMNWKDRNVPAIPQSAVFEIIHVAVKYWPLKMFFFPTEAQRIRS